MGERRSRLRKELALHPVSSVAFFTCYKACSNDRITELHKLEGTSGDFPQPPTKAVPNSRLGRKYPGGF